MNTPDAEKSTPCWALRTDCAGRPGCELRGRETRRGECRECSSYEAAEIDIRRAIDPRRADAWSRLMAEGEIDPGAIPPGPIDIYWEYQAGRPPYKFSRAIKCF